MAKRMKRRVQIVKHARRVDTPFMRVDDYVIKYVLPDGTWTKDQPRISVDRGNSVAAILHDRSDGMLHFVKQFRFSTYREEDEPAPENGWIMELIAGSMGSNETIRECIVREIREETGFTSIRQCDLIGSYYLSPGASSERLFLFYVAVDNEGRLGEGNPLRGADDERIETLTLAPATFLEQVETLQIVDCKTAAAAEFIRRRPELFGLN